MSNFTKRHYEAIAQVLTTTKAALSYELKTEEEKEVARIVLEMLENSLMKMFAQDNDRFDCRKFKRAIGWEL
jgi:hypothetical protein